jgi:hypothetical protein
MGIVRSELINSQKQSLTKTDRVQELIDQVTLSFNAQINEYRII